MHEDFNKLRMISKKLVQTAFALTWQFRIEIEGQPPDFELFVKDVSYCPIEVQTEEIRVGAQILTYPVASAPVSVSMTMREHEDRRIHTWFAEKIQKVLNADGTVNLPDGGGKYVMEMKRFSILRDSSEVETDLWHVYPTKLGDITESVATPEHLEFPITFMQFRSL